MRIVLGYHCKHVSFPNAQWHQFITNLVHTCGFDVSEGFEGPEPIAEVIYSERRGDAEMVYSQIIVRKFAIASNLGLGERCLSHVTVSGIVKDTFKGLN